MKTKLIKLPDYNIIVSDEHIDEGDYYCLKNHYMIRQYIGGPNPPKLSYVLKVIASENSEHNLPSIDYNGLEEKFSIVDIEKLAQKYTKEADNLSKKYGGKIFGDNNKTPFIDGFKKCQELNDKKFSLDDIRKAMRFAIHKCNTMKKAEEYIQSLHQPKVYDIEIDVEKWDGNALTSYEKRGDKPKIVNNKTKILKQL